MENNPDWYRISNVDQIDSPALVIYPDRVKINIRTAIRMVGDVNRLRPHVKTHKSPDVAALMLAAGINWFKCATIAEAEMLAQVNAPDVLLAYQPTGPKLLRFVQLILKYPATKFSCLTDNRNIALEQSQVFTSNGLNVPVFIDLNVGMNRTGIRPGAAAIELYELCLSLTGLKATGLHAYDGHIRDKDFNERKATCDAAFKQVVEMQNELIIRLFPPPVIIAGGSHSFPIHCKRTGIECSPGTFVYWDKSNLDWCPEQHFLPAALVISRIVSLPADGLICTDLGHKSVAAENELTNRVHFLNAPDLTAISQSEEHLVLSSPTSHHFHQGDVLYGLPVHICPTIALYDTAMTIEDGKASGEWSNLARRRNIGV